MSSTMPREPIAIVGMACRLPGDVNSPEEFWELLVNGRNGYSDFPSARLNIDAWHDTDVARPGSFVTRGGYFLSRDLDGFDNDFFGISAVEASTMDPAQKQLLEVAYEACDAAGVSLERLSGSMTGVYVGNFCPEQSLAGLKDSEFMTPYTATGASTTMLSNRINHTLNLKGPSLTVDTACASSAYALHMACSGLQNNDCDAALVCAANTIRSVEAQLFMSKLGALSPTSQCHTFDASADGYARADGVVAFYLMRLSDALRSGHSIRAVVRGTAVGANGSGTSVTRPSGTAQSAVIEKAYENAGINDLENTGYFECHGTGTPVGDVIEAGAVGGVFSAHRIADDPLFIGSVKPNVGHSEGAAALTALVKVVLAVEANLIPPTIGIEQLNSRIDFDGLRLKVVQEPTIWPERVPIRRASINSFGFGGANAHIIVEGADTVMESLMSISHSKSDAFSVEPSTSSDSATSNSPESSGISSAETERSTASTIASVDQKPSPSNGPTLLVCSAKSPRSLNRTIDAVASRLRTHNPVDVAMTLAKRSQYDFRAYAVCESDEEPIFQRDTKRKDLQLGFIFTGGGAQWPRMGAQLLQFPAFLDSVRRIDTDVAALPSPPNWTVEDTMRDGLPVDQMNEPRVAQYMTAALEIALVDLLADWGIHPSMVAGHSAGEIAAAYASGHLTHTEASAVAYYRGKATSEASMAPGAMLAIGLSPAEAEKLIPNGTQVVLGAVNSPQSVTLSGDREAVMAIKESCDNDGVFNRLIATNNVAYHSTFMEPAAKAYIAPLNALPRSSTRLGHRKAKLFSTVSGSLYTPDNIPMSYWRENMESPVMFGPAVTAMRKAGLTHLVEIGPHSTLRSPIMETIQSVASDLPFTYAAAMKRNADAVMTILNTCGELALAGVEVDVPRINGDSGIYLPSFPTYCWSHEIITQETRVNREWRLRRFPRHDLLGSLVPGLAHTVHTWRNVLSPSWIPWLNEYRFGGDSIFPTSGFVSMAVEAMRQVHETTENDSFVIEDLHISSVLLVNDYVETFFAIRKLPLSSRTTSESTWEFDISTVNANVSTQHVKGRAYCSSEPFQLNSRSHCLQQTLESQSVSAPYWYDELAHRRGMHLGERFRRMTDLAFDGRQNQASAAVYLNSPILHPTDLESCFSIPLLAIRTSRRDQAFLPVSVDKIVVSCRKREATRAELHCTAEFLGLKNLHASSSMTDAHGAIINVEGLQFSRLSKPEDAQGRGHEAMGETFWRLGWVDDYDGVSKDNENSYLPPEHFQPKLYDYSRHRRSQLAQMWVVQFSQERPDLLRRIPVTIQHERFIEWINWLLEIIKSENPTLFNMSLADRAAAIEDERPVSDPGIKLSWVIYDHLPELIEGSRSAIEVITESGLLSQFYETQLVYDKFERVVEMMGLRDPSMKIFEIGAGTGSATSYVLKALATGGTKRYSSYTFTDISPSFFEAAATKFAQYLDMEYKVYNMESSPEKQNIAPGSFDLVIASCTVHITPNVVNALKSIRKLLKPGGHLLLSEITAEHHDINFTLGLFPGFYDGYEEGRKRHPFLTTKEWTEAFPQAGFTVPEVAVDDVPDEFHTFTVLTARAVESADLVDATEHDHLTVVSLNTSTNALGRCIQSQAQKQGTSVKYRFLAASDGNGLKNWPASSRLIVIGELEETDPMKPVFEKATSIFAEAKSVLRVTGKGWAHPRRRNADDFDNLLSRNSTRYGFRVASMDFEDFCQQEDVMAREILHRERILHQLRDCQSRQHNNRWLIPRLQPDQRLMDNWERLQEMGHAITSVKLGEAGPLKLSAKGDGTLGKLGFEKNTAFDGALLPGQLEVSVKAVGISMPDFMSLTGNCTNNSLSSEFAGIVIATSGDVTEYSVGDHVFGLWPGNFENTMRVPASMCQIVRPETSLEMAATLPLAYCTAWHAIVEVAHTQPGERILVQSATGGFGMAAIAVARSLGAEVYATAGSASKHAILADLGIPENRIFSSRDTSIAADMMKSTSGQGFDVVLNVSSGDYLHTVSWPLVAPFGRFVELRRTTDSVAEYWAELSKGVSVLPVDILHLCRHKPASVARAMTAFGTRYRNGILTALPHKVFPISQLGQAYAEFSRFEHTGKLVLNYGDDERVPCFSTPEGMTFRDNATYLVVGPLRELTTELTRWIVRNGARRLVFLSSHSPQDRDVQFLNKLSAAGICATFHTGTASNIDHVRSAMAESVKSPICGIIHTTGLGGSLDAGGDADNPMYSVESADEQAIGLTNLHNVALEMGCQLDMFPVLTSEVPPCRGIETQYDLAANDFYWFRRRQNLPCTHIHIVITGPTHHVLELLNTALSAPSTPGASQVDGPVYILPGAAVPQLDQALSNRISSEQEDATWSIYRSHGETLRRKAAATKVHMSVSGAGADSDSVKELIAGRLSKLLWIPRERLQLDVSLSSMGIDSMIASEFRSWIQQTFHTSVSMLELLAQQTTVENLSGMLSRSDKT